MKNIYRNDKECTVVMPLEEWAAIVSMCGMTNYYQDPEGVQEVEFSRATYRVKKILEGASALRAHLESLELRIKENEPGFPKA